MAVLSSDALTLADHAKRLDPNGTIATTAELLSQTNQILEDAVFMEGNLQTGHRVNIRTGLPTVYWRALNQGVPSSKSTTASVDEACGMLEARSEIDVEVAALNGNSPSFRASEDVAFLEAMNQQQATTMFYGNPGTDPKQYLGLAPRYSDKSAGNGQNILDAGGTGTDNASVYLVLWGINTVFCPYPKGTMAGLSHKDLGQRTVDQPGGLKMEALSTLYHWKNGLAVKDWRYVVRIANVDVSDMVSTTGTQAVGQNTELVKLMNRALYRIPQMNMGKACFYMGRDIHSGLANQSLDRSQNVLATQEGLNQFGQPSKWLSFQGVPLRLVDALLNTEDRVV